MNFLEFYFSDVYLPTYMFPVCFPICIFPNSAFQLVFFRRLSSVLYFPTCISRLVFSKMYVPTCIFQNCILLICISWFVFLRFIFFGFVFLRFVCSDWYFPICIFRFVCIGFLKTWVSRFILPELYFRLYLFFRFVFPICISRTVFYRIGRVSIWISDLYFPNCIFPIFILWCAFVWFILLN